MLGGERKVSGGCIKPIFTCSQPYVVFCHVVQSYDHTNVVDRWSAFTHAVQLIQLLDTLEVAYHGSLNNWSSDRAMIMVCIQSLCKSATAKQISWFHDTGAAGHTQMMHELCVLKHFWNWSFAIQKSYGVVHTCGYILYYLLAVLQSRPRQFKVHWMLACAKLTTIWV